MDFNHATRACLDMTRFFAFHTLYSVARLEGKLLTQNQHIQHLEARVEASEADNLGLRREVDALREEIEALRNGLRAELLEMLYPNYLDAP